MRMLPVLGFLFSTITDEVGKQLTQWRDETDAWIESIHLKFQSTVTDLLDDVSFTLDQFGETWFESLEHTLLSDLQAFSDNESYQESLTFAPSSSRPPAPLVALGDPTCRNNALSPHLRCAVNPSGPCEGCPDYERSPEP